MAFHLLLAALALAIEGAAGYPDALFRRIGHPVTWLGGLIARLDAAWNNPQDDDANRRLAGIAALLTILTAGVLPAWVLTAVLSTLLPGPVALVLVAAAASALLAQRSLHDHVAAVATGLEAAGLDGGRAAVSRIVGRDPDSLDEAGVARAAIESLAENFSDGVVAPVFWLALGGLPGAALYKAANTADSMIGHKTPRHLAFGWAAARFDDLINLPASRLTAALIAAAAATLPYAAAGASLAAVRRDARRHRSPNAGFPEAAMAGALGLALAGPRRYGGTVVDDHWMGDGGRTDATAADIRRALALYRRAAAIQWAVLALSGIAAALI